MFFCEFAKALRRANISRPNLHSHHCLTVLVCECTFHIKRISSTLHNFTVTAVAVAVVAPLLLLTMAVSIDLWDNLYSLCCKKFIAWVVS